METRKVQKAGRSSFVVSLPAEWVKAHGIGKNDPVEMEVNSDGSIAIYPQHMPAREEGRLVIDFSHPSDRTMVLRKLIGGYIGGCNAMEIHPGSQCAASARALAADFTSMTIGQEIVEEDRHRIVIEDIANPAEMPMIRALKRMHYVAREVLECSIDAMDGNPSTSVKEIEAMEKDVDRLQWLVARKHSIFLRYPSTAAKESMMLPESNLYFLASRQMERISDHAVSIARICDRRPKSNLKNSGISEIGAKCLVIYDKAMKALFDLDISLANSTIDEVLAMEEGFGKLMENGMSHRSGNAVPQYVAGSLRRVAEYSMGICENTIDYSTQVKSDKDGADGRD